MEGREKEHKKEMVSWSDERLGWMLFGFHSPFASPTHPQLIRIIKLNYTFIGDHFKGKSLHENPSVDLTGSLLFVAVNVSDVINETISSWELNFLN